MSLKEACERIVSHCAEVAAATGRHSATADPSMKRLQQLCVRFGSRLSGSDSLEAAAQWGLAQLTADGLDNCRTEECAIPNWQPGTSSLRLVAPRVSELPILSLGLSVGTPHGGTCCL